MTSFKEGPCNKEICTLWLQTWYNVERLRLKLHVSGRKLRRRHVNRDNVLQGGKIAFMCQYKEIDGYLVLAYLFGCLVYKK